MPTNSPRVSIRLGTDGKAQVQQDFADIADAGSVQAKRLSAAYEKASADAGAAIERQAKAAQRLAAAGAINPTTGAGYDQSAKSAASSAAIFTRELEKQEAEAKRLIASIDPLYAAQLRYAEGVERINAVKATGQLTEERYQQLLVAEETELNRATLAAQRHTAQSGQMRMGMQQLGFQLGDISTQYAMGTRASVIFAQQSGQVIQAFQLMGGEGNKFLEFLRGPWGIALSVGLIALTPLVSKLFEAGETIDDLVEKKKKDAKQSALNAQADDAYAKTLDGVRDATKKYEDALKGLSDQGKSVAERTLEQARASLARLQTIRAETQELINQTRAQIQLNLAQAGLEHVKGTADPRIVAANDAEAKVVALQGSLPGIDQTEARLKSVIDTASSFVAVENGSRSAVEQINRRYDHLVETTRQRLLNEHATFQEIERQTRALRDQEAAAVKAEEAKNRKGANAEHSGGDTIQRTQMAVFFEEAAKYRGQSEKSATLEQFLSQALGKPLDPEKTAWCAAFVNAVLATEGVKGTGSLAARSFLGYGKDDMSSPQRGDIVVVKSAGSPSGAHVGFLDSIDAKGNVRVLAGNTGNKVGEATYSAKDVLGIRRPPTPGEAYASDLKDAEDASDAAVKDFITSLKNSVKAELDQAAQPLADRGKALQQIDEQDKHHAAMMEGLQAELALVGESNEKRTEALRLVQQEYELREKFPAITQAEINKIIQQTAAEDALKAHIAQVEQSMDDARQVGDQLVEDLFNPQNWKSGRDLILAVLKDIEEALLRLAVINPLKNMLFGENNSTLGSILGAVFKIGGAAAGSSGGGGGGDPFAAFEESSGGGGFSITGNAVGDSYFRGGLTWVGEFGKELVRLPRGSRITPAAESRRLAAANDGGIGSLTLNMPISAPGADPAQLARVQEEIRDLKESLPSRVVAAWVDAKQRNVIRS